MESRTLYAGEPVACNESYEVVSEGEYLLLELVPCAIKGSTAPICAFLCASVIGLDPNEVTE